MYALKNRVAEWEIKNEILLGQLKELALSVLGLILFLIWKAGELIVRVLILAIEQPRVVRKVGPGVPPEEIQPRVHERIFEHSVR